MLKITFGAIVLLTLVSCGSNSSEEQSTRLKNSVELNNGSMDPQDNPSQDDLASLDYSISPTLEDAAEGLGDDTYLLNSKNSTAVLAASGCSDTVKIIVNKSKQRVSVFLNCSDSATYVWPVSTGVKGRGTPNFNTRPSGRFGGRTNQSGKYPGGCTINGKWWGNMPYAVYFAANGNYAIHGTCAEEKLGAPASHGCIRVSRANAIVLQGLVKNAGIRNTRIIVN